VAEVIEIGVSNPDWRDVTTCYHCGAKVAYGADEVTYRFRKSYPYEAHLHSMYDHLPTIKDRHGYMTSKVYVGPQPVFRILQKVTCPECQAYTTVSSSVPARNISELKQYEHFPILLDKAKELMVQYPQIEDTWVVF
jgi:hypothetical protein